MTAAHLRPARPDDVDLIVDIHRTSLAVSMPWLPVLHTRTADLKHFRTNVLPQQSVVVAQIEQNVVGFNATHEGWLEHLYIAPDLLRLGIGTLLLHKAQAANSTLHLWTFQRNLAARQFYAAHGFAEVEQTNGASNEQLEPDVRLVWQPAAVD